VATDNSIKQENTFVNWILVIVGGLIISFTAATFAKLTSISEDVATMKAQLQQYQNIEYKLERLSEQFSDMKTEIEKLKIQKNK
jgi:uncharacterized membrane-anchored protein YhcB (DUF1043 family)